MITSHMHLKAPGFPRHPRDDDLVNDFMAGFALADALKSELVGCGYLGLQLIEEDYGWLVVATHYVSEIELDITLSSLAEPEMDTHSVVELMISIQPQKLTKGLLWWKKDIAAEVREFSETVFGFLRQSPGVEVLEEFCEIKECTSLAG